MRVSVPIRGRFALGLVLKPCDALLNGKYTSALTETDGNNRDTKADLGGKGKGSFLVIQHPLG